MGKLEAYLYSRKNIAGCLLAFAGLALHFTGLIAGIEFLPITVGLYLIGALLMPGERSLDLRLDATADDKTVRAALDQLVKSIQGRVPDDILIRVVHIRDSIVATLGNGNGGNGGPRATVDPNVYLIRQTALSYLPEALNAYMALPKMYANRSLAGRKSAHDTLLDQLNLMDQKMNEVAEAIVAHDADRLEAHGRFLAEKFGSSTLDVGTPGAAPDSSVSVPAATTPASVQPETADAAAAERDRVRG